MKEKWMTVEFDLLPYKNQHIIRVTNFSLQFLKNFFHLTLNYPTGFRWNTSFVRWAFSEYPGNAIFTFQKTIRRRNHLMEQLVETYERCHGRMDKSITAMDVPSTNFWQQRYRKIATSWNKKIQVSWWHLEKSYDSSKRQETSSSSVLRAKLTWESP